MLRELLENVRATTPIVHNITNYVTVNDCANILLACGASPIMADDIEEVEDICTLCGGLNINIGTLNQHTIPAMLLAGKTANACGHPIVLDPVGVGASRLRTETARRLLTDLAVTTIRGNASEIKTLALGIGSTKGVDADVADSVTEDTIDSMVDLVHGLAARTDAVVVCSGALDIVADAQRAYLVRNGHPMMGAITGAGCMLSAMTTAYLVANPTQTLEAALAATCAMGLCGEQAFARLGIHEGNTAFRNHLIDAIYLLDGETLENGAHYELR